MFREHVSPRTPAYQASNVAVHVFGGHNPPTNCICTVWSYACLCTLECRCVFNLFCEWKFLLWSFSLSPQRSLTFFSIPLCHPPVCLLGCLTLVFVSSRERIENTTCHELFRGLSLVLHGSVFIIPQL